MFERSAVVSVFRLCRLRFGRVPSVFGHPSAHFLPCPFLSAPALTATCASGHHDARTAFVA